MKIIVITDERPVKEEMHTLLALLERGASVHVRKPGYSLGDLQVFINQIPEKCRKQVSLHGNVELARRYDLGGLHLRSTQSVREVGDWDGMLSRSFHSVKEIRGFKGKLDYVFLSPVFNSISKPGYRAAFRLNELRDELTEVKKKMSVYALGGVTDEKMGQVQQMGFDGAAVLGSIWQNESASGRIEAYEKLAAHEK